MNISLKTTHHITPQALAESLYNSTPEEFADFWFAFASVANKDETNNEKMHAFAKEMAVNNGSIRKIILKSLVSQITYFEVLNERHQAQE